MIIQFLNFSYKVLIIQKKQESSILKQEMNKKLKGNFVEEDDEGDSNSDEDGDIPISQL